MKKKIIKTPNRNISDYKTAFTLPLNQMIDININSTKKKFYR